MLDAFSKGALVFEGKPVAKVESKTAYAQRKRAEFTARRESRLAEKAKAAGGAAAGAAASGTAAAGAPAAAPAAAAAAPREFQKSLTPGVILLVSGLGDAFDGSALEAFLTEHGDIRFIEHDPVAKTVHVRFLAAEGEHRASLFV